MNTDAWACQLSAPMAVALGILTCFWGYRIVKMIPGILGFIAGASGGWVVASSLVPGNHVIALLSGVLGGAIGVILFIWLFFLGICLLGASAGVIVAEAFFSSSGNQTDPFLVPVFAVVFGMIALVMEKFMIIVFTAFSGCYLITAGIFQTFSGVHEVSPLSFDHTRLASYGVWDYVALVLWLVLGLAGMSVQYWGSWRRDEAVRQRSSNAHVLEG